MLVSNFLFTFTLPFSSVWTPTFSKFKSCVDLTETAVKETITAHAIQANKGINKLKDAGFEVIYKRETSNDEILSLISEIDGWIIRSGTKITIELMRKLAAADLIVKDREIKFLELAKRSWKI